MNLFEFVEMIEKRPGMYVDGQSATELDSYLKGFIAAGQDYNSFSNDQKLYGKFSAWVCKKYFIESSVSWKKVVLFDQSNEYFAFQKFFELWRAWRGELEADSGSTYQ